MQEDTFSEITNYVQMTPTIATSGQPTEAQLIAVARAGYRAVINLAMPDSDAALVNEGKAVTTLGMTYVHIPVPFDAPTAGHWHQFAGVMDALKPEKVWVHCVVNYRVSAFVYHYLHKRLGLPEQASESSVLAGWKPKMDNTWKAFLALPLD